MRTTVTIDPDVEVLLRKTVRERGEPFKQVLNNAVRAGLRGPKPTRQKKFQQRTFPLGRPMADLTKALSLAAELEDSEVLLKIRAGR